jgi:hypothetical protein
MACKRSSVRLRCPPQNRTRKKLVYAPEEKPYSGGMAMVSERVELYKGKPQIVIADPKQLTILYDEEVPVTQLPKKDSTNSYIPSMLLLR